MLQTTFLFCYIHKRYSFSHCIQKVSFGQPARQESDKRIVTIHWKTIPYQETLVFRVYFSSSIMELQKCSLANPYREVLEQSHVYLLGLVDTGCFGSVEYLAFFFIFLDLTDNQTKIKSVLYMNIGLLWSLKGQHGWCRW